MSAPALLLATLLLDAKPYGIDYFITQNGKPIGQEHLEVSADHVGMVVKGTTQIPQPGLRFNTETAYDEKGLKKYTLQGQMGGGDAQITLERRADTYRLSLAVNGDVQGKDFPGKTAVEVLENNTAAHFVRIADRYKGGKAQTLQAIVPQAQGTVDIELSDEGTRVIELGRLLLELRIVRLQYVGGPAVELAIGKDQRLYRALITSQQFAFVADQKSLEAYAKAYPQKRGRDPDEIDVAKAREKTVAFESDGLTIYGTLTLPKVAGTKPKVALLIGGSGPMSRDARIGPHRVLADLAGILAQSNIASLRFDKRYFTYRAMPQGIDPKVTFETEVLLDARAALSFLAQQADLDGASPYVVAHSQGSLVALALAKDAPLRGLILLAPPTEPLDQAWLRQQQHILVSRDRADKTTLERSLAPLRAAFDRVKSGIDDDAAPVSALYWKSLAPYAALSMASKVKVPSALVVGSVDYQVLPAHVQALRDALKAAGSAASYHEVPNVNHVLRETSAPVSDGRDYEEPGPIAEGVKKAIADFLKQVP